MVQNKPDQAGQGEGEKKRSTLKVSGNVLWSEFNLCYECFRL